MRLQAYLLSAESVLREYDGSLPFASWLKNYFRENKKFGSRDRKTVSDLCFCYFRLGKLVEAATVEESLLLGQFLCHKNSAFVSELKPQWSSQQNLSSEEKFRFLGLREEQIFTLAPELSKEIDWQNFILSHLIQPDLFLRIRPGKKESTLQKLKTSLAFLEEGNNLRLPATSKVDEVIELDRAAVVQDKSSQQVLNPLQNIWKKNQFTAWDCCAASGGKSILLHDLYPNAQLTVSDIRESILHNLRNRFKRAGIHQYHSFVADVSSPTFRSNKKYDLVICDAPCSGSGTWGRTPEQLVFFKSEKIAYYADLQRRIALNASKSVKENGAFVYITCSVFKEENENVVDYILQNTTLKLQSRQYIKGYTEKADTLFTALFLL